MAVAEELSLSLAQQMETLNINWSSPAKGPKKSTAASILESVGAHPNDVRNSYVTSDGPSPISRQRLTYSPVPKGASTGDRMTMPELCVNTQETTRRRRDSMDAVSRSFADYSVSGSRLASLCVINFHNCLSHEKTSDCVLHYVCLRPGSRVELRRQRSRDQCIRISIRVLHLVIRVCLRLGKVREMYPSYLLENPGLNLFDLFDKFKIRGWLHKPRTQIFLLQASKMAYQALSLAEWELRLMVLSDHCRNQINKDDQVII